jgi:hypothetical protein
VTLKGIAASLRKPFVSGPGYYELHIEDGQTIHAGPALITPPSGAREPAVSIHKGSRVLTVLPLGDATRLAHELADVIDGLDTQEADA